MQHMLSASEWLFARALAFSGFEICKAMNASCLPYVCIFLFLCLKGTPPSEARRSSRGFSHTIPALLAFALWGLLSRFCLLRGGERSSPLSVVQRHKPAWAPPSLCFASRRKTQPEKTPLFSLFCFDPSRLAVTSHIATQG